MNLQQITERVMALTPEQIRHETATGPMGWTLRDIHERTDGSYWVPCMAWMDADGIAGHLVSYWRPDEDRNQSRQVTDKVITDIRSGELLGRQQGPGDENWWAITPLDESRAGLIAWYWAKEGN